jgi:hypothetical protein
MRDNSMNEPTAELCSGCGEEITTSITAAPDLTAWHNSWGTGTYLVASTTLARYSDDELLASGPNSAGFSEYCEPGTSQDFYRPPYSGKTQSWYNCGGTYTTFHMGVVAPESRDCVVLLQIATASEADTQAMEHILDTFDADCGGIAGAHAGYRSTTEVARAAGHSPSG